MFFLRAYLRGLAGARESGLAARAVGSQRDEAGETVTVTGFDGELVLVPPRPVLGRGKRELQDRALVRPGHIMHHAVSRDDIGHGDLVRPGGGVSGWVGEDERSVESSVRSQGRYSVNDFHIFQRSV